MSGLSEPTPNKREQKREQRRQTLSHPFMRGQASFLRNPQQLKESALKFLVDELIFSLTLIDLWNL